MLTIARDELQLKRKVIEQMEGTDKKHQKTMENLLQGFNTLTSALNNGFNLLCQTTQAVQYSQQHQINQASPFYKVIITNSQKTTRTVSILTCEYYWTAITAITGPGKL